MVTTHEQTRAGFLNIALEKNKVGDPYVKNALAFKAMVANTKGPDEFLDMPEIRPFVLTASGLSEKSMKYLDEGNNTLQFPGISSTDYLVFRYGEILLNLAEAAFELGETGEALEAVNDIRKRAGISPLESVDRDKIRHERKVELAFEGHRYWDVRRWRIAVDVLSKPNSGLRYILDYETGKYQLQILDNVDGTGTSPNFYEHNYYFPITLSRTGNNSNLQENPGYQN